MRKVSTSYTKYFNAKYNRTGSLFEGAFKAVHIENDVQAKYLFSYIHLNPVKLIDLTWKTMGIKNVDSTINFLKTYTWSSYQEYIGTKRPEGNIITPKDFPLYFQNKTKFDKELLDWLTLEK
jgi:putative transposase